MSSRAWLLGAFVLLQAADVLLTWLLLTGRPDIVEANPVALRLLQSHGWAGAIALKAATTTVAVACVVVVSRRRPAAGRALVVGLSAVMLAVVGYSAVLLARPVAADLDPDEVRQAMSLDGQREARLALIRSRNEATSGLLDGRLGLVEAVEGLSDHLRQHWPALAPRSQSVWPSPDHPEQVARYLVAHCAFAAQANDRPAALRQVRDQLRRHFPQTGAGEVGLLSWRAAAARVDDHAE